MSILLGIALFPVALAFGYFIGYAVGYAISFVIEEVF